MITIKRLPMYFQKFELVFLEIDFCFKLLFSIFYNFIIVETMSLAWFALNEGKRSNNDFSSNFLNWQNTCYFIQLVPNETVQMKKMSSH
jgi:hypothetical protein